MGELSSRYWTSRDLLAPQNIKWRELSQRSQSQRSNPAPLNDQQAPVLDTLCQTTSKPGAHPHPLTERLPKIISKQTPQSTPLDVVWPNRKTRSTLIHQNTGTSPLHQEAYTPTEPTLATTGGRHQKQKELQTCSLQKGDPKHSKFSKMRRQRNMQQMKEQSKNPTDQTNEEGIGSLPEKEFRVMIVKMIQNLGNRMEKIQEIFNKDLEEQKSKRTMMNTIKEI